MRALVAAAFLLACTPPPATEEARHCTLDDPIDSWARVDVGPIAETNTALILIRRRDVAGVGLTNDVTMEGARLIRIDVEVPRGIVETVAITIEPTAEFLALETVFLCDRDERVMRFPFRRDDALIGSQLQGQAPR